MRANSLVWVVIRLLLKQIVSVDEKNQIMTTNFHLTQTWNDTRLVWNTNDFNGINIIYAPLKKMWVPDTFIYNTADSDGYIAFSEESFAALVSHGRVYFASLNLSVKY